MAEAKAARVMSPEKLMSLLAAIKAAQTVELKVTVPETSRQSAIVALGIDPLDIQLRQVYFFDTPDLTLNSGGLVVRARRVQGKGDDSTVKLRRESLGDIPSAFRKSPNMGIEVDAMPGGYASSASMKRTLGLTDVKEVAAGRAPIRKLYSKEQRAFYQTYAPAGIGLDDLSILGPINVFKLRFQPAGFARKLVAEQWNYPDGSKILELSTKTIPAEAVHVALELKAFMSALGIDLTGDQPTKTKTALAFFSKELRAK